MEEDLRHHPLAAFADHGAAAAGEALAIMLRTGNAGSNTASGHIEVTGLALAQLPRRLRRGVLVRTDSGGGTHDFLDWLTSPGRRLHYSIGMTITDDMHRAILALPDRVWEPAYGREPTELVEMVRQLEPDRELEPPSEVLIPCPVCHTPAALYGTHEFEPDESGPPVVKPVVRFDIDSFSCRIC